MIADRLTPQERAVLEAAERLVDAHAVCSSHDEDMLNIAVRAYRESQQKWRAGGMYPGQVKGMVYLSHDGGPGADIEITVHSSCVSDRDRVLALLNAGEAALAKDGNDARRTP